MCLLEDEKKKKTLTATFPGGQLCWLQSAGLEVCAQETSIITPANGSGGNFKLRVGRKKTRERKMTHMVRGSAPLMESINNATFLTLLCLEVSSRYYQSSTRTLFFSCRAFPTHFEVT